MCRHRKGRDDLNILDFAPSYGENICLICLFSMVKLTGMEHAQGPKSGCNFVLGRHHTGCKVKMLDW